jgi:hypothetical protein
LERFNLVAGYRGDYQRGSRGPVRRPLQYPGRHGSLDEMGLGRSVRFWVYLEGFLDDLDVRCEKWLQDDWSEHLAGWSCLYWGWSKWAGRAFCFGYIPYEMSY